MRLIAHVHCLESCFHLLLVRDSWNIFRMSRASGVLASCELTIDTVYYRKFVYGTDQGSLRNATRIGDYQVSEILAR